MKIGILTLPFGANYGCLLQSYALSAYLTNLGYDVTILSRGWNRTQYGFVYKVKRWIYYNIVCRRLYSFYKKSRRSPLMRNTEMLTNYIYKEKINCVVVGSDQVWRVPYTRGAELNYFLDFLEQDSTIKKISYAASFGTDRFEGTMFEKEAVRNLLRLFNHISVREESGVQICKNDFSVSADCVIDPTLLLTKDDYLALCSRPRKNKKNSIATYILDVNIKKDSIIKFISQVSQSRVVNLYEKHICFKSVEYWLRTILEAEFVIIDSYHGLIFSLLFEKQFLVVNNKKRGSTRFVNLLTKLGLQSRCIQDDFDNESILELYHSKIDYSIVSSKLSMLRENSRRILDNYLKK